MKASEAVSLPNSLTFLRIALTPVFAFFLLADSSFFKQLALVVFIVAALTDWYDGWVARRYGYISRFGKFLDPLADKILSATALFAFVYLDLVDAWMVWIIVGRDFLITGLRMLAEYRDQPIVTSRGAQAKTFGQFVVIYYILILYVSNSIPLVRDEFTATLDALLHPQVLFGMMLVVTLSNVGTGILYLVDNRRFLQDLKTIQLVARVIATGMFTGYSPIVPGTVGTLVGLAIFLIPGISTPLVLLPLIVITFLVGVWAAAQVERELGEDPQIVVIDEIVGIWIALLFVPITWWTVAAAFLFFRIFDVFKPFPARQTERLTDGWGIMLDDVVAAIYANIAVQILNVIVRLI